MNLNISKEAKIQSLTQPSHLSTTKIFSTILRQSESNWNDPSEIIYHFLSIQEFFSKKYRGPHPSYNKDLPGHSVQFCYYDYIEAWFKVNLHQNETYSQSCFFFFFLILIVNSKVKSLHGFLDGGLCMAPFQWLITSQYYKKQCNTFSSVNAQFPALLLFSSKYKVPWIFKWQYEVQLSIVTIRQYDLQMATIGLS